MTSGIGMFDSGLGGLSVARQVLEKLPNEKILYFADNAHVPYGERPLEEIREFALGIVGFLIERGAKIVVMACNMSSAVALDISRKAYPDIPIIGVIEPGAKAAVGVANSSPIGVLATTGTIRSEAYIRAIAQFDPSVQVFGQACPRFVPLVESGLYDSEQAEAAARTYVEPLTARGCKTIVLGCTHYPYVRNAIQAAAGDDVNIVDPAQETTIALEKTLLERNISGKQPESTHEFFASGDSADFATLGSTFLGKRITNVTNIDWNSISAISHHTKIAG